MTIPLITTLPVPPDSGAGRSAFVAAANQFGNDLTPFGTQVNAAGVAINLRAGDAEQAAVDAAEAQADAEAARDAALAAATAVADNYDPGSVVYAVNDLVWDDPGKLYRCILGYTSTSTRPASDPTHWARVNVTPDDITAIVNAAVDTTRDVPTVTKTGALALTDRGRMVRASAGISVPAQATVAWPDGATIPIRNTTGAAISLTPAAGVTLRADGTTKTGTLSIPAYRTVMLSRDAENSWHASGAE